MPEITERPRTGRDFVNVEVQKFTSLDIAVLRAIEAGSGGPVSRPALERLDANKKDGTLIERLENMVFGGLIDETEVVVRRDDNPDDVRKCAGYTLTRGGESVLRQWRAGKIKDVPPPAEERAAAARR